MAIERKGLVVQIRELMTSDPLVLAVDEPLRVAEMFMDLAHVRHLPVVEEMRVVGLVTHRDLLGVATKLLGTPVDAVSRDRIRSVPVASIMRRDVRTIDAEMDVREAIDIMIDHKYGCLPVTTEGHLVGILTEADFLKYAKRCLETGQP
ncbi:MAG: CBS domain-containing protein [Planctomycetota bacterium]